MYCVTNLDIFYKEDLLKIAHCCYDRVGQSLGEINYNDFHEYLNKIVFTKPVDCYIMNPGKTCLDIWKSNNYEVGTVRVAISRECNLHCPMCYVRYGGHHDSLKRKQLYLYTIEKLKNYKYPTKFELLLHFTKNKINEKDLDQIKAFADKEKIPLFVGEEFEVPKESIFNY